MSPTGFIGYFPFLLKYALSILTLGLVCLKLICYIKYLIIVCQQSLIPWAMLFSSHAASPEEAHKMID